MWALPTLRLFKRLLGTAHLIAQMLKCLLGIAQLIAVN